MKITMYELLGLVKDGKAPKKIKYENREYYLYDNNSYLSTDKTRFFDRIYFSDLNIEVEILEEEKKMPEKLFFTHISNYNDQSVVNNNFNNYFKKTQETINEIIDYLKSKGE